MQKIDVSKALMLNSQCGPQREIYKPLSLFLHKLKPQYLGCNQKGRMSFLTFSSD